MMSQERDLQAESFSAAQPESHAETVTAELPAHRRPEVIEIPLPAEDRAEPAEFEAESGWANSIILRDAADAPPLTGEIESVSLETVDEAAAASGSLRDLRLRLRFRRADFYLVVAIAVSTFALSWVLLATPSPGAHRKPRLRPWERALVSLGLAEAPEPPQRRGNPNISVWVDPKTALYYCVGEELYGKAPGGHVATQREAQMDQFEPADRAPCE
jgi:hypothetical protein